MKSKNSRGPLLALALLACAAAALFLPRQGGGGKGAAVSGAASGLPSAPSALSDPQALPQTKYQIRHRVEHCSPANPSKNGVYGWIASTEQTTGRWENATSISALGPDMPRVDGGTIPLEEIKPGDILLLYTDDAMILESFPGQYMADYTLAFAEAGETDYVSPDPASTFYKTDP